jgi:hypothetical protein
VIQAGFGRVDLWQRRMRCQSCGCRYRPAEGCVVKNFKPIKMKCILNPSKIKQVEDVRFPVMKFAYVASTLTIMMSLKFLQHERYVVQTSTRMKIANYERTEDNIHSGVPE